MTDDLAAAGHDYDPSPGGLLPALSELLVVDVRMEATYRWAEAHLPPANRANAATRVAAHIALHRCGNARRYYDAWLARHRGGPPHAPDFLACLLAFIGSDSIGTRQQPADDQHVQGFVAEHIWHLLTLENALTYGLPERVDGLDWSVTDSGGDGLAIYRVGGILAFRLWESKAHTSESSVRDIVNGACRQVERHALRYLARFSKVGQSLGDPELQAFYGRLPEMWRHCAPEAGGGISVSTASDSASECFGNFGQYWRFAHGDQRQGLVVMIEDYAGFAKLVREELWKGL